MGKAGRRDDDRQLEQLLQSLDACRVRDIPALARQLDRLRRRHARGQPIDRGLKQLQDAIGRSREQVELRRAAAPQPDYPLALPVVEQRDAIMAALRGHQVVVVCGETGSGKTTQLPKICLELGRGLRGRIGHTQPRRIAARSLAARIAEELHCQPGEAVGYKVRFHDQAERDGYIKVMTDGILLAEIQSDPELREYDTLIIDEAHERSLNIDFLLGYLQRLLPRRPDLKLIITSATIDPQRFARHFGAAPVIEVSGRTYPVELRYRPLNGEDEDQKDRDRGQAILDAVDELAAEGPGDILVFLPGERAIRETAELLRKHHPPQTEILPLYARLSTARQGEVFRPHRGRRIVLATNVAETSLTVPGIRYVVDTGLARISRYSYRTKVQRLPIEPVSQASANQRAGRCGRVAAGICIRLYHEQDYLARPEFTEPEIRRTSLAAVILKMASLGLGDIEAFPFVDPPDARYVRDGFKLLHELGAVDAKQRITPLGRRLARLPVDPRLARMLLAAEAEGSLSEVLVIVAALEVVDPRERPMDQAQAADEKHALFRHDKSDFLSWLRLWQAWHEQARHLSQNKLRKWCREHFLSYMRMREWVDIHRQLQAQVKSMGLSCNDSPADYRAIHCALLTGLLGNIAFQADAGEYLGARNLKFKVFPGSTLARRRPKWLVAAELVETGQRYLRVAAAIEPAWVEPLAEHLVKRSYSEPHWEKKRGQVVAFERVTLYGLPLVQRRKVNYGPIDPALARELFIRHALVAGEWRMQAGFVDHNRRLLDELDQLESRARRRDLLVDDRELIDFFAARLPQEVYDTAGFQRWWKREGRHKPDLLQLQREQIMLHDAGEVSGAQFPEQLELRGLRLPLRYCFAPGADNDGLCVQLPLAALNQVQASDFDWLVPGMLQEKVALLLKSLPKQLRRHFVPVPEYAAACVAAMQPHSGPLTQVLAQQVERMSGVRVPADAWRPELLPSHLFACFELVDGQGKVIDRGRELAALQVRHAADAQQDFGRVADTRYEREDIRDWDFGSLPAYVEVEHAGLTLRAWPALTVVDGRIDLRLFERDEEAQAAHREGLLALYRKLCGRLVREIRRTVPELPRQTLWFSPVAGADVLQADLERAVLQAVFLAGEDALVREEAAFRQRLETGRGRLLEQALHIGRCSYEALQAGQELRRRLKGGLSPQLLAASAEIGEQLGRLIYPGFVSATPLDWLPHLARYLRAALQRLDSLGGNVERDRRQAAIVKAWWQRYEDALAKGWQDAQLEQFRWMIEELRVSLFAQALGTSVKVSPQRLDRLWREIAGRCGGK